MLVSRAPEAEANLLAAIRAAPAFAGVNVLGVPLTDQTFQAENVYVDSIDFAQDQRSSMKPLTRNDDFTINMVVIVRKIATPDTVKARAWALVAAIQQVVAESWALTGPDVCFFSGEVAGGNVQSYPASPEGDWESRADVRVHAVTIITE
jgi:hypothetical protein